MAETIMATDSLIPGESAWRDREPSVKVRTPLVSEVLTLVHKAKTKPQKVKILKWRCDFPIKCVQRFIKIPNFSFLIDI